MAGKERFGIDKTLTGNDSKVLKLLFLDSYEDVMSDERMSGLVKDYVKTDRFDGRMSEITVQRWLESKVIPYEDMLVDWVELGLINSKRANDSLMVKKYETIVAAEELAAAKKALKEPL